jgi:tRNA threonylcarbamoyladenosine biosynthesis protein TsaB
MKTIALETSDAPGSIALLRDGEVRYYQALPQQQRTTASFAVVLRAALEQLAWRPADVELFAVCQGPGSFTGLRIGVTAAKTFAYATGCRLVALNTLEVIASRAAQESQPLWAVLDAQRQQLFAAQYVLRAGRLEELSSTQLVAARDWLAALPAHLHVTGPGLRKWVLELPDRISTAAEGVWEADARTLGRLATERAARGESVDPWQLLPRYYRPSAAEEKRQT